MKGLFPYSETTRCVTVRVSVSFLPEQSEPQQGRWFWAYHIRLENAGPMAVLGRFTSVFTHTGRNVSTDEKTLAELNAFRATAPAVARALRPLVVAHHRTRRLLGGTYSQEPFDFSLYTRARPEQRTAQHVAQPTARWRW